jgi:hypothetical protein
MAVVIKEVGTAYSSRTHAVHLRVLVGSVLFIYLVFCVVFLYCVCLRPVSYVPDVTSVSRLYNADYNPDYPFAFRQHLFTPNSSIYFTGFNNR